MKTQKGQRDKLEKYLDVTQKIEVVMNVSGPSIYDFTCFGLDANGKLSDDAYMIFYNQTNSPEGAISYTQGGNRAVFGINLSFLPTKIQRLAFTMSIDGSGNMGMIREHTVQIMQNNQSALELSLSCVDFQRERAIITMEFYKKDVWRFSMTASGFNGGLGDLLRHYGGEEIQAQPAPTPMQPQMQAPMARQPQMQTQTPMPVPMRTQTPMQAPTPMPSPVQNRIPNPAQVSTRVQPLMPKPTPLQMETKPPLQTQMPNQPRMQNQMYNQMPVQPQMQNQMYNQMPVQPQMQNQMYNQTPVQPQTQNSMYNQTPVRTPMPATLQQKPGKVSLEKKLEQGAPKLVSLAKPLKVELEKRNLMDCVARVALVLDISGSMTERYRNGTVQTIVNKTLPLAVQFDDDGELDFWYYGTTCRRMPSVNMRNYESAVPYDWKSLMTSIGGRNNEVLVMNDIMDKYRGTKLPVYVLFITDGGVSRAGQIKNILKEASTEPVFWQFVGVGGYNYGVLEQLDNLPGRYVDNANFFALDDFMKVGNSELYARLLNEFPQWLKEIKAKGMIRG